MRRSLAAVATCFLVSFAIVVGSPTSAGAEEAAPKGTPSEDDVLYKCGKPKGPIHLTMKPEVELRDLVTWAMGFSCKKFIYGAGIASRTAKVTMVTPGAMTQAEAWRLFQVALRGMGLTIVDKGSALELLESAAAKDEALAIRRSFPDGGEEVVRLLLRPEHVAVDDLRAALELVKSKHGIVAALAKLDAILVTDDASHIARMRTLVSELDRPAPGAALYAIPLEHVDAATLVTTLTELLREPATTPGASAAGTPPPRLVADARTNALFLSGTAAQYLRVRALATTLDIDVGGDAGAVHLFPLRHAQAKDLATTLGSLLGGATASTAAGSTARPGAAAAAASTVPAAAAGVTTTGPVKVAADETTNALLIVASARDAAALRPLIDRLDAPRRQVYIEALVLEVDSNMTRELGVSWHGGYEDDDDTSDNRDGNLIVGGLQHDALSSLDPKTAAGSGLIGGLFGAPLASQLLGTTVPSIGLLIKATASNSRLDVLASPHLMTIDHKKARISVGANIPYKASTGGLASGTTIPVAGQIGREKVALTLEITPHVTSADPGDPGAGDLVRLDVKLESKQLGVEDFAGSGPTWKERELETTIVLRDQESIVLGGLVDERIEDFAEKVPFLGDLPLVGALFRSTRKVRSKSNLLIIITPQLIDDSAAGRAVLERRMRERDEFIRAASDLQRRVLEPRIDYRKKRGLIAEIDQVVRGIERDRAALLPAPARVTVPAGPIGDAPGQPSTAAPADAP